MSDELVKRARDCANGIGSFKSDKGDFGLLDDLAARIEALEAALEKADALADAARLMLHRGVIWRDEVEREFQAPLKTYQDAVDTLAAYAAARKAVK